MGGLASRPGMGEVVVRPATQPTAVSSPRPGSGHILVPRIGLQLRRQLTFEAWLGWATAVGRGGLVGVAPGRLAGLRAAGIFRPLPAGGGADWP